MKENSFLEERSRLIIKIIDAQQTSAVHYIADIASRISYPDAINKILEPDLFEIGKMWSKEKLSLAQGYVASKITEDILLIAVESKDGHIKTIKNYCHSHLLIPNFTCDHVNWKKHLKAL